MHGTGRLELDGVRDRVTLSSFAAARKSAVSAGFRTRIYGSLTVFVRTVEAVKCNGADYRSPFRGGVREKGI